MLAQNPAGGKQSTGARRSPSSSESSPSRRPPNRPRRPTTDDADNDRADHHHHSMSSRNGRVRVAVLMGGRSSEHDISLASARSVLEALDPDKYEALTSRSAATGPVGARDGRPARAPGRPRGGDATGADVGRRRPGHARRRRRGLPHPPRPVRRGRHRAGAARAGRRPLRRRRRRRLGALHGQGPVQVGHARPAASPLRRNVTLRDGRRDREPVRLPRLREARPARLLGRNLEGATADELDEAVALAFRHDEKVLVEEFVAGVEVECSVLGNRSRSRRSPARSSSHGFEGADWYDFSAKYDEGGMELIVPPRISEAQTNACRSCPCAAFVASECEGMARVDCFVTRRRRRPRQRAEHDPRFHRDERLRQAVRGVRHLVSGAARPARSQLALERHERRSRLRF